MQSQQQQVCCTVEIIPEVCTCWIFREQRKWKHGKLLDVIWCQQNFDWFCIFDWFSYSSCEIKKTPERFKSFDYHSAQIPCLLRHESVMKLQNIECCCATVVQHSMKVKYNSRLPIVKHGRVSSVYWWCLMCSYKTRKISHKCLCYSSFMVIKVKI